MAEFIKDWALEPYTAADLDGVGQHAEAPATTATAGPWRCRLTGIAKNWWPQFTGAARAAAVAFDDGVMLGVDTFKVRGGDHARPAVGGTCDEEHAEFVLLDQSVHIHVCQVQPVLDTPDPKEALLGALQRYPHTNTSF